MEDTDKHKLFMTRLQQYLLDFSTSLPFENKKLLNNKRLKNKLASYNFNKSVLVYSKTQIFSVVSIIALMNKYDRHKNKYKIVRAADLLDTWFNDAFTREKLDIMNIPILIFHIPLSGYYTEKQAQAKHGILNELLRYRQIAGKATWIFYEGIEEAFEKEYGTLDSGIVIQKIDLSQYDQKVEVNHE